MNEACVHAGETIGTHSTGDACLMSMRQCDSCLMSMRLRWESSAAHSISFALGPFGGIQEWSPVQKGPLAVMTLHMMMTIGLTHRNQRLLYSEDTLSCARGQLMHKDGK